MTHIINDFINNLQKKRVDLEKQQMANSHDCFLFNILDDFIDTIKQVLQAISSMNKENENLREIISNYENSNNIKTIEPIGNCDYNTIPNDINYNDLYNQMINMAKDVEYINDNTNRIIKPSHSHHQSFKDDSILLEQNQINHIIYSQTPQNELLAKPKGLRNQIKSKSKEKTLSNNNSQVILPKEEKTKSQNLNNISQIQNNDEIDNTQLSAFERIAVNNDSDSTKKLDLTRRILKKVQNTESNQVLFARKYGEGCYKHFLQRLIDFNFEVSELEQLNIDIDNIEDQPNILPFDPSNQDSSYIKNQNKNKKIKQNYKGNEYKEKPAFENMLRRYSSEERLTGRRTSKTKK